MATKFYYPAFYQKLSRLNNFLNKHQGELVRLNNVTGTELTQLQTLKAALDAIATDKTNWPPYQNQA